MNERFCLQCDDGTPLEEGRKDVAFEYKGHQIVVPLVAGWHCPKCGDAEFEPGEGVRYSQAVDALIREVNCAGQPDLRAIRKKLKLTQAEAGRIFGGGVTAFSRYERGDVKPPVALVKFFQVLDRHPELLAELK